MSNGKDVSPWMDEARQIAAQCWCDEKNGATEMDANLCESVALRIAAWMDTGSQHARNEEYWRNRTIEAETKLRALLDGPVAKPVAWLVTFRRNSPSIDTIIVRSEESVPKEVAPHLIESIAPLYLAAPSAPVQAVPDGFCTWKPMDDEFMPGTYEGSCGTAWSFTEGGVVENDMKYCPHCGRKVVTEHTPQPPAKENGE